MSYIVPFLLPAVALYAEVDGGLPPKQAIPAPDLLKLMVVVMQPVGSYRRLNRMDQLRMQHHYHGLQQQWDANYYTLY
jgi:hypothetical protein